MQWRVLLRTDILELGLNYSDRVVRDSSYSIVLVEVQVTEQQKDNEIMLKKRTNIVDEFDVGEQCRYGR